MIRSGSICRREIVEPVRERRDLLAHRQPRAPRVRDAVLAVDRARELAGDGAVVSASLPRLAARSAPVRKSSRQRPPKEPPRARRRSSRSRISDGSFAPRAVGHDRRISSVSARTASPASSSTWREPAISAATSIAPSTGRRRRAARAVGRARRLAGPLERVAVVCQRIGTGARRMIEPLPADSSARWVRHGFAGPLEREQRRSVVMPMSKHGRSTTGARRATSARSVGAGRRVEPPRDEALGQAERHRRVVGPLRRACRRNGPPPTMSSIGVNVPGGELERRADGVADGEADQAPTVAAPLER